ncbi:hypothetical protein ElyMa_003916800 [Elysia marginata]|uniref:Uncharacterized protein n=1 Tax=Elysia marginata TaxID=1093978 RepID=A0AAV4FQR2_9GAST|nr:hypothetical protein ElyMa_003916800 [Elysia marginata]
MGFVLLKNIKILSSAVKPTLPMDVKAVTTSVAEDLVNSTGRRNGQNDGVDANKGGCDDDDDDDDEEEEEEHDDCDDNVRDYNENGEAVVKAIPTAIITTTHTKNDNIEFDTIR